MNKLRSHLYPSAIAELPWSDSLIAVANNLRKLRSTFSDACQRRYAQGEGLVQELQKLQLQPLRNVYRAATTTPLVFSPEFEDGEDFILEVAEPTCGDELVTIPLSIDGHAINVPAGPLTQLFVSGLKPHSGEEFSRNKLITTRVPPNPEVAEQLNKVVESFSADRLELAVEQELDRIDELVGTALGLTKEEVEFIKREMAEDPFLSRIRPRYPFFTPRQRGRRLRLVSVAKCVDSSEHGSVMPMNWA